MVEAKKCMRCGCMYIAETEVCSKCLEKDGADLYKLKGFLNEGLRRANDTRRIIYCNRDSWKKSF